MTVCNQDLPENKCPKVDCRRDNCCGCPFRKVVIPAAAGDDETGTVIPENGLFVNALVEYEANGSMYIYASDGIFTRIGSNSKSEEAASVAYVDAHDQATLRSAKSYTDTKSSETLTSANDYTDDEVSGILQDAKDYADDKVDDAESAANSYTDTALQAAKDYADAQDAITLQAAKDYTDSAASSVVTRTYVDNGDATTLSAAENYTDSEISTVTNSLATVATTGLYDDLTNAPVVPNIILSGVDPGEGQPLAANSYIGVYE